MQNEQNVGNSRALEPCSRSPLFWEEESFQWLVRLKLQRELGLLLRNPELRNLMKPTTDISARGKERPFARGQLGRVITRKNQLLCV